MNYSTNDDSMDELKKRGIDEEKLKGALGDKMKEAESILEDEEKTNKILDKALKLCDKLSRLPIVGSVFQDIPLACYMISDYVHKKYREIPLASIIMLTGAIMYVVSPLDLIPDTLPVLGWLDDAAVFKLAWEAVHNDLIAYAEWRAEQE